mgnify:CR=1 FL=1
MGYNVGDRIRIVHWSHDYQHQFVGELATIESLHMNNKHVLAKLDSQPQQVFAIFDGEFVLVREDVIIRPKELR